MDGMVSIGEFLINLVNYNKPKTLLGLGQNGTVAGTGSQHNPVADKNSYRGKERT
jgi:hypothetical protein